MWPSVSLAEVNKQAKKFSCPDEHFTVDGTLIQAWASAEEVFRSKDGSDDDDGTDFRGQKRSNDTHQSTPLIPMRGCTRRATGRNRS